MLGRVLVLNGLLQTTRHSGKSIETQLRTVWRVPRVDISRRNRVKLRRNKESGYWPESHYDRRQFPSAKESAMFTPSSSTYANRYYKEFELPTDCNSEDEPLNLQEQEIRDPYEKEKRKCLLCAHPDIEVDYKNPRLLSQFISSFTGRTYDHHITGLCRKQHMRVLSAIKMSRQLGYMGITVKNPIYLNDPQLFDPMRNVKPNAV